MLHSKPITASTMGGTQIQCRNLLVGFWWLAEYSPSQSLTVRMGHQRYPEVRAPGNPGARTVGLADLGGRHQAAQLSQGARLDLADALGGDTVLVGELVERGLVVDHPAALHDVTAALIEAIHRTAQAIRLVLLALGFLDLQRRIGIR